MMLTWKDGNATLPAPTPDDPGRHWRLTVCAVSDAEIALYGGERYDWDAVQVHLPDCRSSVSRRRYSGDAQTERAAQLAAESALLRLGVIRLTWTTPENGATYIDGGNLRAYVSPHAQGPRWAVVSLGMQVVAEGQCATEADAKADAERHLRAELAAWLDALAAKEGVP